MSVTVGHILIGFALVDLVLIFWMVGRMRRANPETPALIILGAAVLLTVALVLAALYHPIGQVPVA